MRYPQLPQKHTTTQNMLQGCLNRSKFYKWHGTMEGRRFFHVIPKRSEYDVFVNTYVNAVSESMIGGNSNARIVSPGPIGMYTIKYPTKNTQDQNAEPYEMVIQSLTAAQSKVEDDRTSRSQSLSLLIRAGFAANKTNIIGASQASFLTRNHSRFIFSHDFAYVPVTDLVKLITNQTITRTQLRSHKGKPYADILALHYLCRPQSLYDLCPKDFYEQYEIIQRHKGKDDNFLEFEDTEHFTHPARETIGEDDEIRRFQVLRQRKCPHLAWVPNNVFIKKGITAETSHERTSAPLRLQQCNNGS